MTTICNNSNQAILQEIVDAIKSKNFSWLDGNQEKLHRYCADPNLWKSEVSPLRTALDVGDYEIMKLIFQPFISFNSYNKMESSDRKRLASEFIRLQHFDERARVHTMQLFMNAIVALDLNEIKFWHEQDLFVALISARDYTLKKHPMHVALAKDNADIFDYLMQGGKCTIPELATNEKKLLLLVDLLLSGRFQCADVLWRVVDWTERITWQTAADNNNNIATYFRNNNNNGPIKLSLIHKICHWTDGKPYYYGVKRARAVNWLLEKGLRDYDTEFPIGQKYSRSFGVPAFVAACQINDSALAKVLLEHESEKWQNNAGPVLENLPIGLWAHDFNRDSEGQKMKNYEETSKILAMLLPLLNPDTKTADLANGLAASILYGNEFLEKELKALGADLAHVSKTDDYHFGKARYFDLRLKLLNLGAAELLLPVEDEDREFIVDHIAVNTRTANVANVRKKMKNIKPDSEIYFKSGARQGTPMKVWDRKTGLIYKESPFIRSLFIGDVQPVRFGDENYCDDRYFIFAKFEEGTYPNGSKIMYQPVEFPSERLIDSIYSKSEDNIEEEAPRRSVRASKRKMEDPAEQQQPTNKRRKIAKK